MPRLRPLPLSLLLLALAAPEANGAPLSLDQAYALALRNNPTLRVLGERVAQAEAARLKAWSALKPTASFQASFTHYDQAIVFDVSQYSPVAMPGVTPIEIQKQNQFAFAAVANLPLFRGAAYPRIGIARKGVETARLRELRSRQEFLLRVAQAYYLVVSRAEAVKALEHKVAVDTKHLASARAQVEIGQTARVNELRADLVLTQDRQALTTQTIGLAAARRQLAILIGAVGTVEVTRPAEPPTPGGSEGSLLADARRGRSDLRASELAIALARQSQAAVYWGFLPTLDLSWMYRWTEAAGFATERGTWNLMLTLNLPIYDGGLRYAELRDARSKVHEAREQHAALGLEVEAEIVRLRAELEAAEASVVSARKALTLAQRTSRDMQASFEVGAATQLDVLDTAQRELDASLAVTSSLYQRDLARLTLQHARGTFDPARR